MNMYRVVFNTHSKIYIVYAENAHKALDKAATYDNLDCVEDLSATVTLKQAGSDVCVLDSTSPGLIQSKQFAERILDGEYHGKKIQLIKDLRRFGTPTA